MKKNISLRCLLFASALAMAGAASAQPAAEPAPHDTALHVVKSSVNAESDNAELCLEFDKILAPLASARLQNALKLTQNGKNIVPQNIVPTASSLCLFPLDRGQPYQLSLIGLRSAQGEKMAAAYNLSFTIPDRSPLLAFTGTNGGTGGFGAYESPLTLRAINVEHAKITLYRIADIAAMAHIWQDRAQTALAPSESAYLARTKGQVAWSGEFRFDAAPNVTFEQKISLRDRLPALAPGLYLIVADAADGADSDAGKPASKGLAPLAAAWLTKSDFVLQAVHDGDGAHVFASTASAAKNNVDLVAINRQSERVAATQSDADGFGLLKSGADMVSVIGTDAAGNVAFADIETLPDAASPRSLGTMINADPFTAPADGVNLSLSLSAGADPSIAAASFLRLLHDQDFYADFPVPVLGKSGAAVSFAAPAAQGVWNLRWQKSDGSVVATAPLRITANPDAPHLTMTSDSDAVAGSAPPQITLTALTASGKPAALIGGRLMAAWQSRDPADPGWKDYHFGTQTAAINAPAQGADFLTDLNGTAQVHLTLPKTPAEPGLYQAVITTAADPDQGTADAAPMILPLRSDATVIGIRVLSPDAHFSQNSLARFALIALSADDRPRDVSGLSYQIYEEGRSFDWYQDGGRWNYKREPQLRPIGGGAVTIKADGGSLLEWPVTAGNYRLEIVDANGKIVAQSHFSAGWDSTNAAPPATPLTVTLSGHVEIGHETSAHFSLPTPAMVTAIIADAHIRKTVHEWRPQGDNEIAFTPMADWQNGVSVSVTAIAAGQDGALLPLQGAAQAMLAQAAASDGAAGGGGAALMAESAPEALILHSGDRATLDFGIENRGEGAETFHYALTASPGLKIMGDDKGSFTLGGRQSRSVAVAVSGETVGAKEIKIEVTGAHTPRASRGWPVAVVAANDYLRSVETISAAPQRTIITAAKSRAATLAFIARRPMQGLPELLSALFDARPFTTRELALSADALRLWAGTLAQAGVAPDFAIAARRQEWMERLLRHQNGDGGFARMRGGDSTMVDTAAALLALGPDGSELARPAKALAVSWLKQRLSNTWFDDKEREPRAAAFAGLAAADAIDPAALHYFSDISAPIPMAATAEADMAAAFKHIHDPDAAAFWIKKMLDEHGRDADSEALGALAATDALSSDDVHAAMKKTADAMQARTAPDIGAVAQILRALAADDVNAGKTRLVFASQPRDVAGVYVARLADAATFNLRNGDAQPVSVTTAVESKTPDFDRPGGADIARHIYRLNGVELSPQARPAPGEAYIVELSGAWPADDAGAPILLQDSAGGALRPIGCALSAKLDPPSFAPWFTPHDLSPLAGCEKSAYGIAVVVAPGGNDNQNFKAVYFAHIDAASAAALPPPQIQVLK